MNAPLSNVEKKAQRAAAKHQAKGASTIGHVVTFVFTGLEMPVGTAVQYAQESDLNADDLPELRDRSAVRKALSEVGIYPRARFGGTRDSAADQAAGESSCYRYSSVKGENGDELFQVFEERAEAAGIVQAGEVQRLVYRGEERKLEVLQPLLKAELEAAFNKWRGAYKSDSIRTLVSRSLARVGATKLVGSAWFVPPSDEASRVIANLRTFSRKLDQEAVSFLALPLLDEPAAREDIQVSASSTVCKEAEHLLAELQKHEERFKDGTRIRQKTVDGVLGRGRELRERLRTLKTLLGVEVTQVESQLDTLQTNVQTFLDKLAADEAQRAQDAARKAGAK